MVKKSFLLIILSAFVFLSSGCVTVNPAGCCSDKDSAQCIKKSASVKTEKGPGVIKKADDWVKENLW